ncbi:hypothetical protein V9K67_22575 [Paraflavisolibacter sp. H34]|uniref:hypothetical protein n=1 Tax=Huijunlia imazamoxiresistens TaxID=3127457 RepID=UPI0030189035
MSFLFSTTFYVHGNPVSYHIYLDKATRKYFFKPTLYTNRNIYPPSFYAQRQEANWTFEGLADLELQEQAAEDMSMYHSIEPA